MDKGKHLFLGGNTCQGFYSFYDYMVGPDVARKYILKGGPGVGKSVFMKNIAAELSSKGYAIEYCWCSSDNNSLDGIVIDQGKICLVDGTAPHVIEPNYPGAVDEVIDLGQFWSASPLVAKRGKIITLTQNVSRCFKRAYYRLKEANCAYGELKSYYQEVVDDEAVYRNIVALGEDFIPKDPMPKGSVRHLFPGAITPQGIVSKLDSIIDKDMSLFAVTGSPGSGVKSLFEHVLHLITVNKIAAEVYHNPFNPDEIDVIILPSAKSALIDLSDFFYDYSSQIPSNKYKRQLDFNLFINEEHLAPYAKYIDAAHNRIEIGIQDAVNFIAQAKNLHDELEGCYIPAMDYAAVDAYRQELTSKIIELLG